MVRINLNKGGYENNQILTDITLNIEKGKFTAIIGPNGSGKTTLLRYLIKELKAQNNSIFIDDIDINKYKQIDLAKKISLLGQYSVLDADFTVEEAVSFGRFCHNDIRTNKEAVKQALEKAGLNSIKDKKVTNISGGEFQLVMLARVLCQNTDIILLDEPSNNLDPKHNLILMDLLKKEVEKGKTVIAVLHDLNSVLHYSDNTVLIKNGQVLKCGKTQKVVTEENIEKLFEVKCKISLCHDRFPSAFCYNL